MVFGLVLIFVAWISADILNISVHCVVNKEREHCDRGSQVKESLEMSLRNVGLWLSGPGRGGWGDREAAGHGAGGWDHHEHGHLHQRRRLPRAARAAPGHQQRPGGQRGAGGPRPAPAHRYGTGTGEGETGELSALAGTAALG